MSDPAQFRRKGHRFGLFIVLFSLLIFVVGVANAMSSYGPDPGWVGWCIGLGLLGVLFGYPLARIWFWAKSA